MSKWLCAGSRVKGMVAAVSSETKSASPEYGEADHGYAAGHRLRHRQSEPLSAGRVHVTVGQVIETVDLPVVEVPVDPPHVWWIRVGRTETLEDRAHFVVGIGERLEDQRDVVGSVERFEERLQQHVHALPREGRAHVQESEASEILYFGRCGGCRRIGRLDSVADHADRHGDAGIAEGLPARTRT